MSESKSYKAQLAMHMRLARGGSVRVDEILDGDKVIGTRTMFQANRNSPNTTDYERHGHRFPTLQALLDAYEAEPK